MTVYKTCTCQFDITLGRFFGERENKECGYHKALRLENERMKEALEKTPSVENIQEWEEWCNGPMILQQARNPGSLREPSPNVKLVQQWILSVKLGSHKYALGK